MSDRISEMEKRISLKKDGIIQKRFNNEESKQLIKNHTISSGQRKLSCTFTVQAIDNSSLKLIKNNSDDLELEAESLFRRLDLIGETTDFEATFASEYDKIYRYVSYENFLRSKLKSARQEKSPDLKKINMLSIAIDFEIHRKQSAQQQDKD